MKILSLKFQNYRLTHSQQLENENYLDGFSEEMENMLRLKGETKGFLFEFWTLLGRNIMNAVRNKRVLFFKMFQNIFTSVLQSLLYINVNKYFFIFYFRFLLIILEFKIEQVLFF